MLKIEFKGKYDRKVEESLQCSRSEQNAEEVQQVMVIRRRKNRKSKVKGGESRNERIWLVAGEERRERKTNKMKTKINQNPTP